MSYADKFFIYGPYRLKETGRQIVIVIDKETGNKRTVSYPKWLVECDLGHPLDKDLHTIDHFDSDINNNELSNLRIMPRDEHSREDTRRVKLVKFKCALCNKEFERSPRLVRDKSKKNMAGPFCNRQCSGRYSRQLQLKLIDKMSPQPMIESEYYKKKYVQAHQLFILATTIEFKLLKLGMLDI